MLKFIDENDFLLVDVFKENEDGTVMWVWNEGEGLRTHSGMLFEGFIRVDENGETIDVWKNLIALSKAEKIKVQWLTDEDKTQIEAERQQQAEKQAKAIAKHKGVEIAGQQISLTEENQNGMAAVMQGVNLAAEMGADIFPLNFNAQTPAGFKLMTFEAAADFKTFCLTFMAERQKFFK